MKEDSWDSPSSFDYVEYTSQTTATVELAPSLHHNQAPNALLNSNTTNSFCTRRATVISYCVCLTVVVTAATVIGVVVMAHDPSNTTVPTTNKSNTTVPTTNASVPTSNTSNATHSPNGTETWTDYCQMLGMDDIQGKKAGFLAGNKVNRHTLSPKQGRACCSWIHFTFEKNLCRCTTWEEQGEMVE